MEPTIRDAIDYAFVSSYDPKPRGSDEPNVVDGLMAIADALGEVAEALHKLGLNDAATQMGAIESLSYEVKNGFEGLSQSMSWISDAIGNSAPDSK